MLRTAFPKLTSRSRETRYPADKTSSDGAPRLSSSQELFTYSSSPAGHIRILSLDWKIGEDTPHGRLGVCSLDNLISYEALSYARGDPEPTFASICNVLTLRLPSNLNLALHRIAAPGCSRHLWIDLICINQNDGGEKAGQIRLLNQIYGGAENVEIWLGEAPKGMDLALRSIPSIQNGQANIGGTAFITTANFEYYGLSAISSSVSIALGRIFSSSWLERLWTLQEDVYIALLS